MYCGDETGAIVIDTGSAVTKVGWSGRDMPDACISTLAARVESESREGSGAAGTASSLAHTRSTKDNARTGVFPSQSDGQYGPLFVGDAASKYRPNQDIVHLFEDGNVLDWDGMECLLRHSLATLGASASDHPLLLLEHALAPPAQRERMAELLFEGLDCPAAYLAKQSQCAAMSAGLAHALVLDLGASHCRACPVTDGYQLHRPVQQSPLGMRALAEYACRQAERDTGVPLRPRYACTAARLQGADPRVGAVSIPDAVLKEAHLGAHSWTPGGGSVLQGANPSLYSSLQGTRASFHAFERTSLGEDIIRSVATVAKYAVPRQQFQIKSADSGGSGGQSSMSDGGANGSGSGRGDQDQDQDEEEEEEDEDDESNAAESSEEEDDEDDEEEEDYCLPDGRVMTMGRQRLELGEILFDTSLGATLPTRIEPDLPVRVAANRPPTLPASGQASASGGAAGDGAGSATGSAEGAATDAGHEAGDASEDDDDKGAGRKRGRVAYEMALRPRQAKVASLTGAQGATLPQPMALHRLVHTSLSLCDVDIRPDLCRNVLLCGGGSLVPGLADRLQTELSGLIPSSYKPRVVFGTRLERQFAHWIGGSVMSSLGTFQQLWIGQKEYEEEGPGIVERRCS